MTGKRSDRHTAARRAVARLHHPDVGGDPEVYAAELAAVDRRFAPPTTVFQTSRWKQLCRSTFRKVTRVRRKNYFDI